MLLQADIHRTAVRIVADQDTTTKHLLLICVWQMGAHALIKQYREFAATLPTAHNLEIRVVTKDELMNVYQARMQQFEPTTLQLNRVCENISSIEQDKIVHLFVDECWLTVPKEFSPHMTQVSVVNSTGLFQEFILPRLIQMRLWDIFHLVGEDLWTQVN